MKIDQQQLLLILIVLLLLWIIMRPTSEGMIPTCKPGMVYDKPTGSHKTKCASPDGGYGYQ